MLEVCHIENCGSFWDIYLFVPSGERTTKPPGSFIAGEAAESSHQVTCGTCQVTGNS